MNEIMRSANKECFQLTSLPKPTPCFQKAGGIPCEGEGCPVTDRINELKGKGIEISEWWKKMLPHSVCRISSLSRDNAEFNQRLMKSEKLKLFLASTIKLS